MCDAVLPKWLFNRLPQNSFRVKIKLYCFCIGFIDFGLKFIVRNENNTIY